MKKWMRGIICVAWWVAPFAAMVILCLPRPTDAKDHRYAQFRCGKTFVTFHAMQMRKNGTGEMLKLHTVRKAHIQRVYWVPPSGPPFVEWKVPEEPAPYYLGSLLQNS